MPPATRRNKGSTALKENLNVVGKTISKAPAKTAKHTRKVLADKTNSASDDNASIEVSKKVVSEKPIVSKIVPTKPETKSRPRRDRRLPTRYVENVILKNLSNSNINVDQQVSNTKINSDTNKTPRKDTSKPIESPFKTPQQTENSLFANRPKRICRLPSKFEDHSVSPSKYIPVVPCHASTPITGRSSKRKDVKNKGKSVSSKNKQLNLKGTVESSPQNQNAVDQHEKNSSSKLSSDSNNNAKQRIITRKVEKQTKDVKQESNPKLKSGRKVTEQSFSFRVLEDKKASLNKDTSNIDVYEFTYDPNEEPPPKKKRKRTVNKKPSKPKTIVLKNNYDRNVAKAMAALKSVVSKKPDGSIALEESINNNINTNGEMHKEQNAEKIQSIEAVIQKNNQQVPKIVIEDTSIEKNNHTQQNQVLENKNYNSVRVEDIAAEFDYNDDAHEIDYSPVNTPYRVKTPTPLDSMRHNSPSRPVDPNDPLNLRRDLSFFDDIPVASSSMNVSTRHPQASPWRVEFGNLPIKWHVNAYVKPNMTPAVESSFVNFEDNKKKHVYTDILPQTNEPLPEVVQGNSTNYKQTSIISYIKEVVEKSSQKKRRGRSVTPIKENNLFDELRSGVESSHHNNNDKTPKKSAKKGLPTENVTPQKNVSAESVNDAINDKENCCELRENKTKKTKNASAQKDKNCSYFGFDDSENQENISPAKTDNPRARALRPRARAVLQEINAMTGPTRSVHPVAAKSKVTHSSDAVNKVYDEMKSATDAPSFPDKGATEKDVESTNVNATCDSEFNEDSQSVHLFEDIEIVHHLKPSRKSYGKAKKVAFQNRATSDSDSQDLNGEPAEVSDFSEEDDLADLTFTMPAVQAQAKSKKKKMVKKKNMSKKEEKALEAWAAGFNSMCEDIEEFPLVVE